MQPNAAEKISLQHAAENDEENVNRLGMWVFLTSEVMFFGAMFTAYIIYRHAYPLAFEQAGRYTEILLGGTNTAVLLTSSLTMALAVNAIQNGRRKTLVAFLAVTMLLGAVFLGLKGLEYVHKISEDLFPGPSFTYPGPDPRQARVFFSLYFIMTGLHAAHMIIGILAMALVAFRGWLGHFSPCRYAPVEMLGLYWHFVDIVWIFLFPLFYLIKRP